MKMELQVILYIMQKNGLMDWLGNFKSGGKGLCINSHVKTGFGKGRLMWSNKSIITQQMADYFCFTI